MSAELKLRTCGLVAVVEDRIEPSTSRSNYEEATLRFQLQQRMEEMTANGFGSRYQWVGSRYCSLYISIYEQILHLELLQLKLSAIKLLYFYSRCLCHFPATRFPSMQAPTQTRITSKTLSLTHWIRGDQALILHERKQRCKIHFLH
jgi:hypothetical protein